MIRTATSQDVMELDATARPEDRRECEALSGQTLLSCLAVGLFHSDVCITGIGKDGGVVLMGGIVPTDLRARASVWLVCAPTIKDNKRELLSSGREWLDEMNKRYPVLHNYVDARNTMHLRLLRHLGCTFMQPIDDYGASSIRVVPFERTRYV